MLSGPELGRPQLQALSDLAKSTRREIGVLWRQVSVLEPRRKVVVESAVARLHV